MTDRELLEAAAKAAGYKINAEQQGVRDELINPATASLWINAVSTAWNPLNDDCHALRLAVKLSLDVVFQHEAGGINRACKLAFVESASPWSASVREVDVADPFAATRRAITRAAAALGGDEGRQG